MALGADFRRFWASNTVSMLGTQVTAVALPLLAVLQLNASTFDVGVLGAAEDAAWLLIGLPAGAWVDRWRRRHVVVLSDVGRGLLLLTIPVAAWLHVLTLGQLWLVALMVGALTVFFSIAYQAYVPSLVDRADLVSANAQLSASQSGTSVAGRGLAGPLVQLLGAPVAILVDAVSYLASALLLNTLRTDDPKPVHENRPPLRRQIAEGLGYVLKDPILRALTACGAGFNFFLAAQQALIVVFLVRTLAVPTSLVGVLLAAGGVGGVLGAAMANRLARRTSSGAAMRIGLVGGSLSGLLIPAAGHGWAVLPFAVGYALLAVGTAIFNVVTGAFRQAACPPEMLSRMVSSTRVITWGALPLGGLAGGLLGELAGVRTAVLIVALGYILVTCALVPTKLWRARDLETSS